MAKPSDRSPERKLQVVLSVLRGEASVKEAARRAGVAEHHNSPPDLSWIDCCAWLNSCLEG